MPDWRIARHYAYTRSLDRAHWAWEFLRRNADYRADWRRFIDTWRALEQDYGKAPQRDFQRWKQDPRAYAATDDGAVPGTHYGGPGCAGDDGRMLIECWMGARWGFYKFPLDPDYAQPEMPDELAWRDMEVPLGSLEPGAPAPADQALLALVFDLSLSLKPQLSAARLQLAAAQRGRRREGRVHGLRGSVPQWTLALRLLDARRCGETHKAIAAVLVPPGDSQSYEGLRGVAESMVNGGYRRILSTA